MPSFPDLNQANAPFMHPSARIVAYHTAVNRMADGTEQRWPSAPTEVTIWQMRFNRLSGAEVSLIRKFFLESKGRDATNWDVTVDAVLYSNMSFNSDELVVTERQDGAFSLELTARQVVNS